MSTWREVLKDSERQDTLREIQYRIHAALYFDKPLTADDLRELDRDIEGALRQ